MRAKIVNEDQNFERGQDPKTSMDVGMTPERILDNLKKELEKFNISIEWRPDNNMGKGFYYININDDDNDYKLSDMNLQIGYMTDKASMAEYDISGGFWLAEEGGDTIIDSEEVSHDSFLLIKHLLTFKYGEINHVNAELISLKSLLAELDQVKIFLEK